MTDWSTLIKNRQPAVSVTNSAHLLECVQKVMEKYPAAVIEKVDGGWQLSIDGMVVSGVHNSHYACWAEVMEAMREPG